MLTESNLEISPQDWLDWKKDRRTQEVFRVAQLERSEWANRLLEGDVLDSGNIIAETGKAVGVLYGLDFFLVGIEEALRLQWQEAEERKEAAANAE